MKNETLHDWLALIATGLVAVMFMRSAFAYNAICRAIQQVAMETGETASLGFMVTPGKYVIPIVLLSVTAALVIHYYLSENKMLITLTAFVTYLVLSLSMSYLVTKPILDYFAQLSAHRKSHSQNHPAKADSTTTVPKQGPN